MSGTMPPYMVQGAVRSVLEHANKIEINVCYEQSAPDQLVLVPKSDYSMYDSWRAQGIMVIPEDGVKMSIPMLREMIVEQRWADLERYVMVCAAMVKQPLETRAEPAPATPLTWWTSTTTTTIAHTGTQWVVYPISNTAGTTTNSAGTTIIVPEDNEA